MVGAEADRLIEAEGAGGEMGGCLLSPGCGVSVSHREIVQRSVGTSSLAPELPMSPESLCCALTFWRLSSDVWWSWPIRVSWNEGLQAVLEALCADWPPGASLWATEWRPAHSLGTAVCVGPAGVSLGPVLLVRAPPVFCGGGGGVDEHSCQFWGPRAWGSLFPTRLLCAPHFGQVTGRLCSPL